jgi:hypothetical protein
MSARSPAIDVVLQRRRAEDRIEAGLATINGNMAGRSRREDHRGRPQGALKRIKAAETLDDLADCDLVIEAATENETVKRKIFADLCPVLKPDAIVATNTSSISITRLAAATDRPERFIGIHFMNPVPLMELVELIRGIATDDETFEAPRSSSRQARQDHRGGRGLPGLHRQPHPAADDQRGDLHALRGRRLGRGDRHRDEARRATIRWGRCSWPTSSASTPACRSCRCCTRAWPTPSTGPARCW